MKTKSETQRLWGVFCNGLSMFKFSTEAGLVDSSFGGDSSQANRLMNTKYILKDRLERDVHRFPLNW